MSEKNLMAQAQLLSVSQAAKLIASGAPLVIAGDETLLATLPKGSWIGGSIPYFMAESGGIVSQEQVFVYQLPTIITEVAIANYDEERLWHVVEEAPDNGFSIIILPAGSEAHTSFARNAPNYPEMFLKPLIGWISGVHLSQLGQQTPKVFNGQQGAISDQDAVVIHARLPDDVSANIGIINLFQQGDGDTFSFPETGFNAGMCLINGQQQNFADYLLSHKVDTRLPLVANYCGAMINVSFQGINEQDHEVNFYAPVFEGVEYKLAQPVPDYVAGFQSALPENLGDVAFSCNCILNFLYGELENKHTGHLYGPITFGEVAYQLLNQTMVYLTIERC